MLLTVGIFFLNAVQQISVLGAGNEGEHNMVCDPTKVKLHGLSMRCFLLRKVANIV